MSSMEEDSVFSTGILSNDVSQPHMLIRSIKCIHVTHSVTWAWREGVVIMDRAKHMDENVAALNFEATSNHVEEEVSSRRTNLKPPSFFKGLRCLVEMSLLFLPFSFLFREGNQTFS
jgi:hypothetical protein